MFRFLLALLALSTLGSIQAQDNVTLSKDAEISLLTCSPGEELYSLFGHSAMRVRDVSQDLDIVFNYGTFAFNEDFYYNFSMGRLNYRLAVQQFDGFMREYVHYKRGVVEQVLDLDSLQKAKIFDFLKWNYLPENRYYPYDFFYDNCSSRLRDVLDTILNDQIVWADLMEESEPSFRNIIDRYLIYHPWGDFGIDLGLGLPCDKVPNSREYMFLPDKLLEAYDNAEVNGKPLVVRKHNLLEAEGLKESWSLSNPTPLFWLLFGIVAILSAIGYRKGRLLKGLDLALFVIIGAVGALIFFLWFITDHEATANNFNMLWAWPTHILAIPLLFFNKWRRFYFMAYGFVLLLTLILFPFLPQMLHVATIPLMLMMLTRAAINWKMGVDKS